MSGRQVRAVVVFLLGALPADAQDRMAGEDAHADVREERPVDVALDALLLLRLVAHAQEADEVRHVAASHQQDADADDDGDPGDRRGAREGEHVPSRSDDDRSEGREADSERARDGAGEDEPDRPARARHPGEDPFRARRRAEREQREPDRERGARERGQVVDAEERGLALERPLALELRDEAGELEQAPGARCRAPRGHAPEQELDVTASAEQERDGGGEDCVLGELRRRHEVRHEAVVLRPREPVEGRRDDHRHECRQGDPDGAPGAKGRPALADAAPERRERDGQNGQVGELDPDARRAEPDVDLRLVADVEEDDRDRECEDDRSRPLSCRRRGRRAPEGAWTRNGARRHDAPR